MVVRAGLEPATTCLEGRCSIQLSYRTDWLSSLIILPRTGVFSRNKRGFGGFARGRDLKIPRLRPIFIICKKIPQRKAVSGMEVHFVCY